VNFATHTYANRKTHKEDARLSQARSKTARELTSVLKGNCESGEQQARNSVRTPEGWTLLLASTRRQLTRLFRSWRPIPAALQVPFRLALFRDRRYFLPTTWTAL